MTMLSNAKYYQFSCCETSAVAGTFAHMIEVLDTARLAVSLIVARLLVLERL